MAGNARFHNKWHRKDHHSRPTPGFPSSATDPIASKEEPFVGDMVLANSLCARGDLKIDGNATIIGNLSVFGDLSYLDTVVSVTSALSVVNLGTGPALTVMQLGAQPIARFIDADGPGGLSAYALSLENNGQALEGIEGNWELHLRGNLKGYENWLDRKSTRLNSSHRLCYRMPSSA